MAIKNELQNLFNFFPPNIALKNLPLNQIKIDKDYIKETLPNAKWIIEKRTNSLNNEEYEVNVLDFNSTFSEISKRYPHFIFEKEISKHETFTYYGFIVKKVFEIPEFQDIRVSFYETDLANLLRVLDEVKKNDIKLVNGYKGYRKKDKIEIGVYANRNLKKFNNIYSLIEKGTPIEYNLMIKEKQIKIFINQTTPIYKTLFTNIFYDLTRFSISIESIPMKTDEEIINFIKELEIALNLKLYYDYQDMIEFSRYIQKSNNPSPSHIFYLKPQKKEINKDLKLMFLNPIVLTYMQNAIRTDFLPFRYLAYYHILEYYFIECYEKFVEGLYMNKPKKIEDIDNLLETIKKYRSEEKMLELLIKNYIKVKTLMNHFGITKTIPPNKISEEIILPEISISDQNNFSESLSKRIYKLRNAIVHSKAKKTKGKSLIYMSVDQNLIVALSDEVQLIKWIAERIIEANTKTILTN